MKRYYSPKVSPIDVQPEDSVLLVDSGKKGLAISPIDVTVTPFSLDDGFSPSGFKDASFGDGEISFL